MLITEKVELSRALTSSCTLASAAIGAAARAVGILLGLLVLAVIAAGRRVAGQLQ
jgi:hypothetical protein